LRPDPGDSSGVVGAAPSRLACRVKLGGTSEMLIRLGVAFLGIEVPPAFHFLGMGSETLRPRRRTVRNEDGADREDNDRGGDASGKRHQVARPGEEGSQTGLLARLARLNNAPPGDLRLLADLGQIGIEVQGLPELAQSVLRGVDGHIDLAQHHMADRHVGVGG
jgi:hypothetical protein